MEEATLLDVKKSGETLVLMDGRRLYVNPGDTTKTILWLPTTALEIDEGEGGRFFALSVRNVVSDETINARWL
jgi:hypothetical protein